jgi:hypothetical protein
MHVARLPAARDSTLLSYWFLPLASVFQGSDILARTALAAAHGYGALQLEYRLMARLVPFPVQLGRDSIMKPHGTLSSRGPPHRRAGKLDILEEFVKASPFWNCPVV